MTEQHVPETETMPEASTEPATSNWTARYHRSKLREEQAKVLRRGIRSAQLRVSLDKQRGRETPEAVVRVSKRKMPRSQWF